MTPSEYIEWLDKEIESVRKWKTMGSDPYFYAIQDAVLNHMSAILDKARTMESPYGIAEKIKQALKNGYDDYCEAHDLPYRNECPLCPPLTDELPENNFTDGL